MGELNIDQTKELLKLFSKRKQLCFFTQTIKRQNFEIRSICQMKNSIQSSLQILSKLNSTFQADTFFFYSLFTLYGEFLFQFDQFLGFFVDRRFPDKFRQEVHKGYDSLLNQSKKVYYLLQVRETQFLSQFPQ